MTDDELHTLVHQFKCTLDNMGKDKSIFQAATDVTAEVFGLCSTMPISHEHFPEEGERKYRYRSSRFELAEGRLQYIMFGHYQQYCEEVG